MYTMRVDPARQLLTVEMRGRLSTEEALRAVSQGFTLAEASRINGILCDVNGLVRGPGGLLIVAAALAARFHPTTRMAVVGNSAQLNVTRRLIRFSGVRNGLRTFDSTAEAEGWLAPVLARPQRRLSGTALRHAASLLGDAQAASDEKEAALLEHGRRSSPAA